MRLLTGIGGVALALLASACVTSEPLVGHAPNVKELRQRGRLVYFLECNGASNKVAYSPDADRAAQRLKQGDFDRILVVSLGWGIDHESIDDEYLDFLDRYHHHLCENPKAKRSCPHRGTHETPCVDDPCKHDVCWETPCDQSWCNDRGCKWNPLGENVLVLCVGWDSGQTGFRRFFNDILPFHTAANALAYVPDRLFFPLSFWSKAVQADRIGYWNLSHQLKRILFEVAKETGAAPPVYLIGHSFGCRVLNGLIARAKQEAAAPADEINKGPLLLESIAGGVMILPAIARAELERLDRDPSESRAESAYTTAFPDDVAPFPMVVLHSRYDRANSFLFPLANIPLNTHIGGLADRAFIDPKKREQAIRDEDQSQQVTPERKGVTEKLGAKLETGRSLAVDLLATPVFAVAVPLLYLPANYTIEQVSSVGSPGHGLPPDDRPEKKGVTGTVSQPIAGFGNQVMHTLANLPIVDIPVRFANRAFGKDWGTRKGFLDLGILNESVGSEARLTSDHKQYTSITHAEFAADNGAIQPGYVLVDASSVMEQSYYFDAKMSDISLHYAAVWLDPIGAHNDFRQREVFRVIRDVIARTETQRLASPGARIRRDLTKARDHARQVVRTTERQLLWFLRRNGHEVGAEDLRSVRLEFEDSQRQWLYERHLETLRAADERTATLQSRLASTSAELDAAVADGRP